MAMREGNQVEGIEGGEGQEKAAPLFFLKIKKIIIKNNDNKWEMILCRGGI